jgi:hypothetical protein
MTTINLTVSRKRPGIVCDEALRIARQDAEAVYGDLLSAYRITLLYQPDGWHVDYDLVEPLTAGGGPHYVIDGTTGQIVSKRYEQ